MEASRDNLSLFHHDNPVFVSDQEHKMKYLSHRFYNFMKGVPELRYELKGEDSLRKLKFYDES